MFSACDSSQISSIDSYTAVRDNGSGGDSVEDLMADMAESVGDFSSKTQEDDSGDSSRSSVLDALSFSSDSDDLGGRSDDGRSSAKLRDKKARTGQTCIEVPNVVIKPTPLRRTRSAMGTYIPPPGGSPLSKSFFTSPGPAAYNPKFATVKPSAPEVLLKFRHKIPVTSYGPGPGAYMATSDLCCPDQYIENHFAERFTKADSLGPGPGAFDLNKFNTVGRYKPKAIILSRPQKKTKRSSVRWPDLFGFTRFGKCSSPNPLIIGKPLLIPKYSPGPGAYSPEKCRDCRIGIEIRGLLDDNYKVDMEIPGPKYMLPPTLGGPAWTLISRRPERFHDDSPGPIYKAFMEPKKPISLTFKPFPVRGREDEPSPQQYSNVRDQYINTLRTAPKALIGDRHYPNFGMAKRPGPNQYYPNIKVGFSSYNECAMKGFRRHKTHYQPGPADYNVSFNFRRSPCAVIAHKHKPPKVGPGNPGFKYTPKVDRGSIRNVFLSPRWPEKKLATNDVPFQDLTGFTAKGKKNIIPVGFKSRQSPFVYQGVSSTPCTPAGATCNLGSLKYDRPELAIAALCEGRDQRAETSASNF